MEVNYNYNNGTILKFLRKVLNEINQEYVDSGMRTAFLLKRYIEKYKNDNELGPQHVLLCMMKDIGLFYMNGEVPDDNPAYAAASSYTFLEHCSPLGVAARPLLFYKAKYIESQSNDDYDLGLLMTLLNDVIICIYEAYNVEEIEDYLKEGKEKGNYKPDQVRKVIKLLRDEEDILPKLTSESNLYVYETQKYISTAGYNDSELEKFIDTTSFAFEFHNHETLAHTITTAEIAEALAIKCKLTKETAAVIKIAARVHDIGKIRVPREVLCFPGRLEGEMLAEMQRHVVYTKEIIEGSFSYKIVDIAANHHEKLDGSGYPRGLKSIDLSSGDKVIAVADICSALYCRRSYKAAFDDEKIKDILLSDAKAGKLDIRIVNHLIDNFDEIMAKAKEEEAKVLEKYENMKAEYEALTKSSALMHFFDIPEQVEEPSENEEEIESADAQVTEEFLEEITSEEDDYVAPDEMFTEDEFYNEEEVVYVDENGNVIENYETEEVNDNSVDEFAEYTDTIPEETSEEVNDEFDEYASNIAEEPISEDYSDNIKEDTSTAEFDEFINTIPEEDNTNDEFEEFINEIPEEKVEDYSDSIKEDATTDEFEEYVETISEETTEESVDEFQQYAESIPEEDIEESKEDEFEEYVEAISLEEPKEEIIEEVATEPVIIEPEENFSVVCYDFLGVEERAKFAKYFEALVYAVDLCDSGKYQLVVIYEGEQAVWTKEYDDPGTEDEFEEYINTLSDDLDEASDEFEKYINGIPEEDLEESSTDSNENSDLIDGFDDIINEDSQEDTEEDLSKLVNIIKSESEELLGSLDEEIPEEVIDDLDIDLNGFDEDELEELLNEEDDLIDDSIEEELEAPEYSDEDTSKDTDEFAEYVDNIPSENELFVEEETELLDDTIEEESLDTEIIEESNEFIDEEDELLDTEIIEESLDDEIDEDLEEEEDDFEDEEDDLDEEDELEEDEEFSEEEEEILDEDELLDDEIYDDEEWDKYMKERNMK